MRTDGIALPEAGIAGRAATLLAELGERAECCSLYDEDGSSIYHELAQQDHHEVRELISLVRGTAPGPVLDLAAGSGRLTMPLLALGREVTALELSPSMLDLLRERLERAPAGLRGRATLVRGDMSDFALGSAFACVVLATTSISLLDEAGRAGLYASVRRHLAPGGRFLLTTVDLDGSAPAERELNFSTAAGNDYRMFEYWEPGMEARVVSIFPARYDEGPVRVGLTSIRVLPADRLEAELNASGLRVATRHPLPPVGERHHSTLLEVEVAA
ncbi:daptide-type RiPP biosynthesis methyltransferase [Streptomyces sp. NBC_00525]|uniref:daptide-type RiPP biosynthesis methyltransferase n=1 Tax=Streptomyces sp. NBC_00525 TaxID=2903660 RepID=UPI002E814ED9|nr:daptide-type RiPP biosynthesis methyltransferase [Streptomyces sp. NBC_00525]WUC94338.1 class I SAM-dependent methyltransferase [Streptomyces sp. NBC_00525]